MPSLKDCPVKDIRMTGFIAGIDLVLALNAKRAPSFPGALRHFVVFGCGGRI
jgi:hypothetical protein